MSRRSRWLPQSQCPRNMLSFLLVLGSFAVLAGVYPQWATALDQWEANKGDCDIFLLDYHRAGVEKLRECVTLWETYKDVTEMSPADRRKFAPGISRLYHLGNNADQNMATYALQRMRVPLVDRDQVVRESAAPQQQAHTQARSSEPPPVHHPEVSAAAQRRSENFVSRGEGELNRKRYSRAIGQFERAMDTDPNNLYAIYLAATTHMHLNDFRMAIDMIRELATRRNAESRRLLARAVNDDTFLPIKRQAEFKRATGYTEILLLNGAGPEGRQHMERLNRDMTAFNMKPAFVGTDKHPRARPMVYFREGFEEAAERMRELLNNKRTRMRPIDFNTNIDQYSFDLIVVWGMPHRARLKDMPTPTGGGGGADPGGGSDPLKALEEATEKAGAIKGAVPKP